MISTKVKTVVERYQCVGCVVGNDTKCYLKSKDEGCERHVPGTFISGVGTIFLGMPKGFNRIGNNKTKIQIFEKLEDYGGYDYFNIPVWKYKDEFGNILVRGLSPRINSPFIHIFTTEYGFSEDLMNKINCYEITKKELEEMD